MNLDSQTQEHPLLEGQRLHGQLRERACEQVQVRREPRAAAAAVAGRPPWPQSSAGDSGLG